MATNGLGALWRMALDMAEATGAIELLRQRLETFLENWPERDELIQRWSLLPVAHRRNVLERLAMHLAVHKHQLDDRDGLVAFITGELARAEREARRG